VKLTDFGLARDTLRPRDDGSTADVTETGDHLGTWLYSAPEQFVDPKSAGAAVDVYSLGAVLYHALSGRSPFGHVKRDEWARAVSGGAPPLEDVAPRVPKPVRTLVARALAIAPEARPEAHLLAAELGKRERA
jgi:serine/threonine protein kinase